MDDGPVFPASKWGTEMKIEKLELSPEEAAMSEAIRAVWSSILSGMVVEEHTDFFKSGAGSMDVTRWVWSKCGEVYIYIYIH